MNEPLFMFLAQGTATRSTRFRAGARHALILYGKGIDIASARSAAIVGAGGRGWDFVEVQREKEIAADLSIIEDDIVRSAAEDATRIGHSMIVYKDELPLDG